MALLGIANSIIISIFLLLRSETIEYKYFLSGFFMCLGIVMGGSLLISSDQILSFPHLAYVHSPFTFLVAPLFYFYVRTSWLGKSQRPSISHFIPFILASALHLPFYFKAASFKVEYLVQAAVNLPLSRQIFFWVVLLQLSIYLGLILKLISKRSKKLSVKLKAFIYSFTGLLSVLFLVALFRKFTHYSYDDSFIGPSLIIIWIIYGYYSFFSPTISRPPTRDGSKYIKSGLDADESKRYVNDFLDFLQTDKPYLNPNLTLAEVSHQLNLKPTYLSQAINQRINKSFTEVLNEYRVKKAAEMIGNSTYDHLSIEGISREVGFKSKSAFYSHFKRIYGTSPKLYEEFQRSSPLQGQTPYKLRS